jgi:streptogramin lyase
MPVRPRTLAEPARLGQRWRESSVPLGGVVDGLAAGGGYLWALVVGSGVLTRVDQRTGQVRRFALPGLRGHAVVVAAAASWVWLADQHSTGPDLIKVDAQTGQIAGYLDLPGHAGPVTGLAAAYGWLWMLIPDDAFPPGWRVIQVYPATGRTEGASADTPGTQLSGHTAAICASAGKLWITGSMNAIVSVDPRTLAMHWTATAQLSEGLVFGDGYAWALNSGRPRLAKINPHTGQVVRMLATPLPSLAGDDYVLAGPGALWVFRGAQLTKLNPQTGRVIASARVSPIAPAVYSPAVTIGTGLWYLAQTSGGTALDHVTANGT